MPHRYSNLVQGDFSGDGGICNVPSLKYALLDHVIFITISGEDLTVVYKQFVLTASFVCVKSHN
jgi:hypothetical protein